MNNSLLRRRIYRINHGHPWQMEQHVGFPLACKLRALASDFWRAQIPDCCFIHHGMSVIDFISCTHRRNEQLLFFWWKIKMLLNSCQVKVIYKYIQNPIPQFCLEAQHYNAIYYATLKFHTKSIAGYQNILNDIQRARALSFPILTWSFHCMRNQLTSVFF